MRSVNGKPAKLEVRWSVGAQRSLDQTMAYSYSQDTIVASLVIQRLSKLLDMIAERPAIGTPTNVQGLYRLPIPKTGHIIEYRVSGKGITIMRWARHTRKS